LIDRIPLRGLGGHSFVLPVSTEVDGLEALRKGQRDDAVGRGRTVKTNDTTLAMQLVQSGFGLAYLPRWVVQDELESGALELAIEGYTPFTRTLYAAYKNRRFLAPKIRTFIDFMAVALAEIAPTEQHADVEPPSF
jgi:DNA-binding transcriptional LysR family regulator